ncbi:MarR family winged helix-turn-helix transcriptional regulator [Carnobacterium gallinarum]|uniref:MarR family winged helix-turn-helix transcriptional regulator n=1 Tax=Carnobacterium gallinarum TaxID=2749 RepID=UPI00054E006A|nr:MarR family transcriptional regulator [Carnobacterium gallinarum]
MENREFNPTLVKEIMLFNQQISDLQLKILTTYQLTLSHFNLLLYLKEKSPLSLKQLTHLTQTEKSTLSRQVTNLMAQQWLMKEQTLDKRVYLIHLTSEGLEKLAKIDIEFNDTWKTLFSAWPEDEQQLLFILLGRINRNFKN